MVRRVSRLFYAVLPALTVLFGCAVRPAPETGPPTSIAQVSAMGTALPHRPEELPPPEPIQFTPPKPQYVELENGIRLYVLEDHELPLVNVAMLIGNGSRCDPPDKPGVANFTADVMRRGGSTRIPGDALDDTLDFLAASISVGMEVEVATANLNVLSKDFDTGLSLFADVIMHPAFPEEKLEEAKRIARENIRRRDDDPYEIGRRKFRQVVYGEDNPWARQLEMEDVNRITRDDLVRFHRTWFRPNIAYMAISGDITTEEVVAKVRQAFAEWQPAQVPEIALPPAGGGKKPGVYLYPKEVTQSAIRMGWIGMPRHSPDEYAVEVMNRIFGAGTFTSRLGREVRSNRGLAYYVYGAVFDDPDPRQGMFLALAGTRADKTAEAIAVMRAIIDSMRTQPIADEEMRTAKEMIINSFIFQYDSPRRIVEQQMRLAYFGYPDDYLETYIPRIRAVTKDDVLRVARKYLQPDSLRIVVVGDSTKFDRPLSVFGPVTVLPPDRVEEAP